MALTQLHLDMIAECESKIREAEETGMLLVVNKPSMKAAFTPAALRREQAEGFFCIGAANFTLVDVYDEVALESFGRYN